MCDVTNLIVQKMWRKWQHERKIARKCSAHTIYTMVTQTQKCPNYLAVTLTSDQLSVPLTSMVAMLVLPGWEICPIVSLNR